MTPNAAAIADATSAHATFTPDGVATFTPAQEREILRHLEPVERMEWIRMVRGLAVRPPTFAEHIARCNRKYQFYWWSNKLIRLLQDVADDLLKRLMVFVPPRHGKSELVSRLFPSYFLLRHPERFVGLATYGQDLSDELALAARSNYVEAGGQLYKDNVRFWRTAIQSETNPEELTMAGGMWAVGVGGPATGKGGHLLIVDDPVKDQEEAQSRKTQRRNNDWFDATFASRLETDGAMIVTMTRWHQTDLAGWIIANEAQARERWHVLIMPAIRENNEPVTEREKRTREAAVTDGQMITVHPGTGGIIWPETMTFEPDERKPGDALCPERKDLAALTVEMRRNGGANGYWWSALYQQRPTSREGGLFKREMFIKVQRAQLPKTRWKARHWDLAATDGAGAYTAGLRVERTKDDRFYITGLKHGQWAPAKRDQEIKATARAERGITQLFPQDPGAAGKQVASQMIRLVQATNPAFATPESGDKEQRAELPASAGGDGRLYIVDEPWAEEVIATCVAFGPGAEFKDIVDALSGAFAWLAEQEEDIPVAGSHSMRNYRG